MSIIPPPTNPDFIAIEIVSGVGGLCLCVNNYRVCGAKPLGGGTVTHRWNVRRDDFQERIVCALPEIEAKSLSKQITGALVEENNLDSPHFHGETYEREIDQKALKSGFFKVFDYMMRTSDYRTDVEIADATGVYLPSVQRMRSYMRKPEWGGHTVHRRRRAGQRIFEFYCEANQNSLTYKYWQDHRSALTA